MRHMYIQVIVDKTGHVILVFQSLLHHVQLYAENQKTMTREKTLKNACDILSKVYEIIEGSTET